MTKNDKLSIHRNEESLDPANWDQLEEIGHEMVTDMIGFLKTIKQQPVWTKPPEEIKNKFKEGLPAGATSFDKVYSDFKNDILPYSIGNIHPRFWSWVMGTGSAQGMLADMLASGMNSNVGIGDQSPMYVDQQVINWCKEIVGFPAESGGALVNGGSVANLNALIVARNSANYKIRKKGLMPGKRMVMYASSETHSSIQKAAEIIGIGSDGVRKVNIDSKFEMDVVHLEKLIDEDLAEGNFPFCVVANVGTVNTGAIDPLDRIFWVCSKRSLWMHVDGAFGALLKLLPEYKDQLTYLDFVDSVAFDLHKWMYMPYEAGVVLVNDIEKHRASFALQPDYLLTHERGVAAGPELTSNFGFDLSRSFKALKVWMLLKENGIEKYKSLIRQNLEQAKHLERKIDQSLCLQLMAPVSTNIVCFRYYRTGLSPMELNELNKEILMEIQEEGIAAPSYTILNGNYCLRVANVNHRSTWNDFDILVKAVEEKGRVLFEKILNHKRTDHYKVA